MENNFKKRCEVIQQCLPKAKFRNVVAILHDEILAELETLRAERNVLASSKEEWHRKWMYSDSKRERAESTLKAMMEQEPFASKECGMWAGISATELNKLPNGSRLYLHPVQPSPAVAVPEPTGTLTRINAGLPALGVRMKPHLAGDASIHLAKCNRCGDEFDMRNLHEVMIHEKENCDKLNTSGNRNPEARYKGYKGEPLPKDASEDEKAAWLKGRNASLLSTPTPSSAEQSEMSGDWTPSGREYDKAIHHNPDAKAWADLFVATFPRLSDKHEIMLGWFANAMMTMHDHIKSKDTQAEQPDSAAPNNQIGDQLENFICYLIDNEEGAVIAEETLHHQLSAFLKNSRYNKPSPDPKPQRITEQDAHEF